MLLYYLSHSAPPTHLLSQPALPQNILSISYDEHIVISFTNVQSPDILIPLLVLLTLLGLIVVLRCINHSQQSKTSRQLPHKPFLSRAPQIFFFISILSHYTLLPPHRTERPCDPWFAPEELGPKEPHVPFPTTRQNHSPQTLADAGTIYWTTGWKGNITIDCDNGNGYDGRIGVRISSIFVIGLGSMLGALLPIAAARTKRMRVPPLAFFITKYFGSGVIIATAFIHLLSPANKALNSPCNTGLITNYDWAAGTALMTIFLMFFIELMAARFDVFGAHAHDLEATDPAKDLIKASEKPKDGEANVHKVFTNTHSHSNGTLGSLPDSINTDRELGIIPNIAGPSRSSSPVLVEPLRTRSSIPGRVNDLSYPPGGEDHLGHQREHMIDHDHFAAQMTALFILEFGVIFHSVFIGLTLAVTGDEFNVLYIVLAFHQTFEGLGLGSRLATAEWPKKKLWMPWALGFAYGMATPLAIAIGLGVRQTFTPNSQKTRVVNGVFDAISAGILIYTGLVELMAHEFMFNPEMRKSSIKMMLFAFFCMCVGAGLMALLGKWA